MRSLEAWRQLCRAISSRSCPPLGYARGGNQVALRNIAQAPPALLGTATVAFSAAQDYSPATLWAGARTGPTVPLLGLAAAAASVYACTATMEAENLREEADAQERDGCTPANTPPQESAEAVTEKFTGIQFPLHVRTSKKCGDGGQQYHLLGTAVRYTVYVEIKPS